MPKYLCPEPGTADATARLLRVFLDAVIVAGQDTALWPVRFRHGSGNPDFTASGPVRAVRLIHEPPPGEGENDFDYWTDSTPGPDGRAMPELVIAIAPTALNETLAQA